MKRRSMLLGGAVLLLVLLNVWHWTAGPSPASPRSAAMKATPEMAGADLVLRMASVDAVSPIPVRDLFQAKVVVSNRPRLVAKPLPPPKTPEQIAEEQARAELAQIKLLGVVFRGDQGEAFLTANGSSVTARTGARVGNHFVVERITPEIVDVRDPDTHVSGQLKLLGQ